MLSDGQGDHALNVTRMKRLIQCRARQTCLTPPLLSQNFEHKASCKVKAVDRPGSRNKGPSLIANTFLVHPFLLERHRVRAKVLSTQASGELMGFF